MHHSLTLTLTKLSRLTLSAILLTVALVGVLPVPTAHAATFTVNSTADAVDTALGNGVCATAGGVCTLRAAIQEADALAGDDTITLPAGTYQLTIAGASEDASATGDLDITANLTINGAGAATTIIQQTVVDRVFHVTGGYTVNISGVTVRDGRSSIGGGIYNRGTTTITSSTFSSNVVGGGGGGGILNNAGTVTITNSTFSSNVAGVGGGGGILNSAGTVTITNSTFSGNSTTGNGGGIYISAGTATITNSTFSGNSATTNGGGIYRALGTVTLKNTIVANSTSGGNCGGTITNGGNNLQFGGSTANSCGAGISTADPNLGALTGSPAYFSLNTGSAAIDAGDNTVCAAAPVNNTSQNGVTRPLDGDGNGTTVCDIGSYEAPTIPVPASAPVLPSTSFNGNTTATDGGAFYLNAFYGHVHVNEYGNLYRDAVKITSDGTTVCIEVPVGYEAIGPTCFTDKEGGRKDFFIKPKASTTTTTNTTTNTTNTTTVSIPNGVTVGASGGTFNLPSSGQLVIPPNLLADGSTLKLESVANTTLDTPNGLRPMFHVFNAQIFNSAGTEIKSFTPPLQLCYSPSDSELASVGGDAKSFVILTSSDGKTLQELATTPDTANKKVCASVNHFSLFELAARTPTKIPTTGEASSPMWLIFVALLGGAGVGWFVMRRKTI